MILSRRIGALVARARPLPALSARHVSAACSSQWRWRGRHEGPGPVSVTALVTGAVGIAAAGALQSQCEDDLHTGAEYECNQTVTNWSATHSCNARKVFEPHSTQELLRLLQFYTENDMKLRPVGTALSPNGIGLTESGADLVTVRNIDHMHVDEKDMTVTVGAGATVDKVLTFLKGRGLTLENFSSIQEQQIAGWTQVAAHGTGVTLPTVEEQIVQMKLATPGEGLLTLSSKSNPQLFALAKVGLGSLGVVTELTLRCVELSNLEEKTACVTRSGVHEGHLARLEQFRHVRYMWIPHTDTVVTVCSSPADGPPPSVGSALSQYFTAAPSSTGKGATKKLCDLLVQQRGEGQDTPGANAVESKSFAATVENPSVADLRSALLEEQPLGLEAVNRAEEAYWRESQGTRRGSSTEILGFDCGGEQLVYEVCIPMGRLSALKDRGTEDKSPDIAFVEKLLSVIEDSGIPAPSPIEQRWTARSTAPMSPAYSADPEVVFSWVGVIMYLPQDPQKREQVATAFRQYCTSMNFLVDQHGGQAHWAKVELPEKGPSHQGVPGADRYEAELRVMRERLARKYPVERFSRYRAALDPQRVLGNALVDELFPQHSGAGHNSI